MFISSVFCKIFNRKNQYAIQDHFEYVSFNLFCNENNECQPILSSMLVISCVLPEFTLSHQSQKVVLL